MGKFSVEGIQPPRRPLYLLPEEDPYTPKQLQALRDAHASAGPVVSFDPHWPRVRDEARKCAKALELEKMLKPHRNVWWRMNKAVREGTVAELLETCPQDADALLYGAMRAGIIQPVHGRQDYEEEFAQLCRLGADERKAALAFAKGTVPRSEVPTTACSLTTSDPACRKRKCACCGSCYDSRAPDRDLGNFHRWFVF